MQQALSIGKAFSDSMVLVPIYHSLSMLYNLMPKPGQALQYARLNYSGLKDTLHCYRTFLLLGNAYFLNGQYDSADIFLQKNTQSRKILRHQSRCLYAFVGDSTSKRRYGNIHSSGKKANNVSGQCTN